VLNKLYSHATTYHLAQYKFYGGLPGERNPLPKSNCEFEPIYNEEYKLSYGTSWKSRPT
jgi:hypothetical protein